MIIFFGVITCPLFFTCILFLIYFYISYLLRVLFRFLMVLPINLFILYSKFAVFYKYFVLNYHILCAVNFFHIFSCLTIDFWLPWWYNNFVEQIYRGVEQLAARWAHNPKVASSSLAPATKTDIKELLLIFKLSSFYA